MSWNFYQAHAAFDQQRDRWDELNAYQGNHILLDSHFVSLLIRHFASEQVLVGISNDRHYPGMVLIEKIQGGFWRTFQPSQGPLGLILLGQTEHLAHQLQQLMRSLPGYAFGFSVLQQDPDISAFQTSDPYTPFEIVPSIRTSRIPLLGNFEDYWSKRGRYYIADLRRQSRRLAEQGIRIDFVRERDPSKIEEAIQEYGRLESMGWKGITGTAVMADNRQGMFYQELLEHFCRRNEGIVYKLQFNGHTVACDLCLERGDMIIVLKIAYDESQQGFSPGKFLHREMLRQLFAEGKVKVLEWYGRIHEWQMKLSTDVRDMYHLNVYRHPWVAAVRRVVKTSAERMQGRTPHKRLPAVD